MYRTVLRLVVPPLIAVRVPPLIAVRLFQRLNFRRATCVVELEQLPLRMIGEGVAKASICSDEELLLFPPGDRPLNSVDTVPSFDGEDFLPRIADAARWVGVV